MSHNNSDLDLDQRHLGNKRNMLPDILATYTPCSAAVFESKLNL